MADILNDEPTPVIDPVVEPNTKPAEDIKTAEDETITLKAGKGGDKFVLLRADEKGEISDITISNMNIVTVMGFAGILSAHAQKLHERSQLKSGFSAFLDALKQR